MNDDHVLVFEETKMTYPNEIQKGKLASAKGFANESRLLAALLKRGYDASKVDLPHSTYDLIVEKSKHDTIRIQVKTVSKNKTISFKGGVRGGKDRSYRSNVKSYIQNTDKLDIVVGVESHRSNGDTEINFYFIPTLYIEQIQQSSLSINKVPYSKNNWNIVMRCKDISYVSKKFQIKGKN